MATIIVNNSSNAEELNKLASDSGIRLDVTWFDLSRLPPTVKAELFSRATKFIAPQLQRSGDIYADNATSFSAARLQRSGDIYASNPTSFDVPSRPKRVHGPPQAASQIL